MNTIKDLVATAESLFTKKKALDNFWQEIAENFYPERADFTATRNLGEDWGQDLMSSYPCIVRRDLAHQVGMMLRPRNREWFRIGKKGGEEISHEAKEWLDWFAETMRRAMYDPVAQFNRAMGIGDHDFSTFGQTCYSAEVIHERQTLLYRTWHLRDMAWQENEYGEIGFTARKWKPTFAVAIKTFGKDALHTEMVKAAQKTPFETAEFLHICCDGEMCPEEAKGRPKVSIWWDVTNQHLIHTTPMFGNYYHIPRWQLLSSQYAHSPAVVAALPDARLIQSMTFTLLEAGEKTTNPPLVATSQVVQTTPATYAGGITWVDKEYDERLGAAIQPFPQDYRGLGHGMELTDRTANLIREAFFLNKLTPFNPAQDPEMTAYQAGQYVQEWIRNAMPIFEPMEAERNASVCEATFDLMTRAGAFGSPLDWPRELHDMELEFQFESPLHDAIDAEKGQKWMEAKALLAEAVAVDPETAMLVDSKTALRDALEGINVPQEWLRSEQEVDAAARQHQQQVQQQAMLEAMQTGAAASKDLAAAQGMMGEQAPL